MQISILNTNEVYNENITFRIDAEFFKREYLEAIIVIEKFRYSYIADVTSWVTQGPNPIFSEVGIPCLTGRNINKGEVSYSNPDFIGNDEYKKLSRFQIKTGDTLITLKGKGSIGKIGYVIDNRNSIFSRDVGILRPNKINPGYLNVFILCKYGQLLIARGETGGTGQSTLTTSYLKSIPVPRFGFEDKIGEILEQIESFKFQSQNKYKQAQNILFSELDLTNWQPKHQLSFIKNYSDIQHSERIDAEYYQPKYEEIITAIKNYVGGWSILSGVVNINMANYTPQNMQQFQYIELSNIAGNGEISGCMTEEGQNLPTRARRKVTTGDIIVSSIEGSLSSIALIEEEYDQALCSTGFYVINSEKLNSETLLIFLKGFAGQLQLKKGCNGTILTAINNGEFSNIVLPIITDEKQTHIQQKVTESFALRKKSKHLLESAKKAVEMAIEQDEQTAINWLELQIKDCQLDNE